MSKGTHPVYDSPEWRALSSRLRRQRRACEHCGATGKRTYVDHVIELRDGGAPFAEANCQVLCAVCHGLKTANERAKRARVAVGDAVNEDGFSPEWA